MIICLFGASCVGKTTIAEGVSSLLGLPLRSCGNIVRSRAQKMQISLERLPDDVHREIDLETIEWASSQADCILEGRFLDLVFSGGCPAVVLIKIDALIECRIRRGQERSQRSTFSEKDILRADAEDLSYRCRMFSNLVPREPWRVLDTTNMTIAECIKTVQNLTMEAGRVSRD